MNKIRPELNQLVDKRSQFGIKSEMDHSTTANLIRSTKYYLEEEKKLQHVNK